MHSLNYMKRKIDKIGHFDVALIAAGGYGMPLGDYIVHQKQKHAVVMGGVMQLLFGIKGKRWDKRFGVRRKYNKNWIFPLQVNTPNFAKAIEFGGPYWGEEWQTLKKCPV